MLRVWGGGIYPPDWFYDICDTLGIMVWQDFMFAGTTYPYSDEFLKNVRKEAKQQVLHYQSHPSLAMWCGNNEVSEGFVNWDWQESMGWSESAWNMLTASTMVSPFEGKADALFLVGIKRDRKQLVEPIVRVFADKLLAELPLALLDNEIYGILIETERRVNS